MLTAVPQKTCNLMVIYGIVALLSVMLVVGYLLLEKKKDRKFVLLFSCVAVANCGYFLQAVSPSLTAALWANRVSYLGSAYLVLLMLLIVMDVCQMKPGKGICLTLFCVSTGAFLLASGGSWLGLYYRAVDIMLVNGATRLVKEYGPMHILYPVYLLSYFALMVAAIVHAARCKKLASGKFAVFLVAVVLLNIGVWAVEQAADIDFEFLCVSYIVTEIILLLIYSLLRDYGIVQPGGTMVSAGMLNQLQMKEASDCQLPQGMEEMFAGFAKRVESLSPAERRILQYYIEGHEAADIPELAFISIHTVKKHNRSIYQKLEIGSRDELMLYIELFRCCGRLKELTGESAEL